MRRAALPAVGILGIGILGTAGPTAAAPWDLTVESGMEADSNVSRVETGDRSSRRVAAAAGRAGARVDGRDRVLGGSYFVGLSGLIRIVGNAEPRDENVLFYAGELRWLHPVRGRAVATGVHLTMTDSFAVLGGVGARTFRNLGGDAVLVLGHHEDHRVTLELGGRDFSYKPAHMFDWRGPVGNARYDGLLWHTDDRTRSLEIIAIAGLDARRFDSHALAGCAPGTATNAPCSATQTSLRRRDRYQRASVELRWAGGLVATGSYQLTVIDSNSFAQSLIRQRVIGAITMELFGKLLGTATATLQIDQYPEGIPIEDERQHEFTSLEDENRSSLQLRLARALSTSWSLETRAAVWRDFDTTGNASFRRELVYAGIIFSM